MSRIEPSRPRGLSDRGRVSCGDGGLALTSPLPSRRLDDRAAKQTTPGRPPRGRAVSAIVDEPMPAYAGHLSRSPPPAFLTASRVPAGWRAESRVGRDVRQRRRGEGRRRRSRRLGGEGPARGIHHGHGRAGHGGGTTLRAAEQPGPVQGVGGLLHVSHSAQPDDAGGQDRGDHPETRPRHGRSPFSRPEELTATRHSRDSPRRARLPAPPDAGPVALGY